MSDTAHIEILLAGEPFYLLAHKALYRPLKNQLILSDVHLGKATHFRKMGIPMPAQSHLKDIDTLHYLLNRWQPETLVILGDLFHSDYNREWLWFKALLMEFPHVTFILVEGNHDILQDSAYNIPNLIKTELLEEEHFIFSHHPLKDCSKLNICGHVHPGLRLYGPAKQSVALPCFYFNNRHFILPAFGNLTGMFLLNQEEDSFYYLVMKNKVVQL
jgi:DNA ligase-associated metallophosphoesterase